MSILFNQNYSKKSLPAFRPNTRLNDPELYISDPALEAAVEVALALGQPLLLTGDPGVGKSQLAYYLANKYGLEKPELVAVQTSSVAKDLFYRYDALGHFHYNQHEKTALSPDDIEQRFIRYQGIGAAIKSSTRTVVLIDEIDKAPRDLPNDILTALDRMSFEVPEIKKTFSSDASNQPVVIITSNSEKNLPDPFLRRVVYYHIPFPSEDVLIDILTRKLSEPGIVDELGGLHSLVEHFMNLRNDDLGLRKKPSTSELLLWADFLIRKKFALHKLGNSKDCNEKEKEVLRQSYSVLAKSKPDLDILLVSLSK